MSKVFVCESMDNFCSKSEVSMEIKSKGITYVPNHYILTNIRKKSPNFD